MAGHDVDTASADLRFRAVVLAGERPGGGALARELGVAANVLAPLAGHPCITRVVAALRGSSWVSDVLLCGPNAGVVEAEPAIAALLRSSDCRWMAPEAGPAASALAGIEAVGHAPVLLTSGDHGLLDSAIVSAFCASASALHRRSRPPDIVVGLVPYSSVRRSFPDSKRTLLRFADGTFCGSNLFAVLTPEGRRAVRFWARVEADRKRPWRIARRIGPMALLAYLSGRLQVAGAFARLSARTGCEVAWVPVDAARAAVDVDSVADWELADALLRTVENP